MKNIGAGTNKIKKKIPYFRVTFYGEYYYSGNGEKTVKPYEETFNIAAEKASENFWLYCVTSALPKIMSVIKKDKYPGFCGLRSHHLKGDPIGYNGAMVNLNIDDFSFKSRKDLLEYIRIVRVPINPDLIKSDIKLREILTAYKTNKSYFERLYKETIEAQKEDSELEELNSGEEEVPEDLDDIDFIEDDNESNAAEGISLDKSASVSTTTNIKKRNQNDKEKKEKKEKEEIGQQELFKSEEDIDSEEPIL